MSKQADKMIVENEIRAEFVNQNLPDYMLEPVLRYAIRHERVGDFLLSLFRNDGREFVVRADALNLAKLRPWIWFLIHGMPPGSCGSAEKVEKWLRPAREEAGQ